MYFFVPLLPPRGQHTVLCHPRWQPTQALTVLAVDWGGAGFESVTTALQSGALSLSHLSSSFDKCGLMADVMWGKQYAKKEEKSLNKKGAG